MAESASQKGIEFLSFPHGLNSGLACEAVRSLELRDCSIWPTVRGCSLSYESADYIVYIGVSMLNCMSAAA
jgi:hypothetical protein